MKQAAKLANIIIVLGIALAVAALAYLLYRQSQGIINSPMLYAIPGGIIVLLAAVLALPPMFKINIALSLVSLGLMLYALEAYLMIFGNPLDYRTERYVTIRNSGGSFDTRLPLDVTMDLRRAGEDAYLYVPPSLFTLEPQYSNGEPIFVMGGISDVTTVHCNEGGEYLVYESDRYGFHNPSDIWEQPAIDILALGDSFTQGACVPSDKNFVGRIREAYPNTLSLGASGNGPLSTLGTLREYGAAKQPKTVIWFYFEGNDMGDLMGERSNDVLTSYLDPDFIQDLAQRQEEINELRKEPLEIEMAGALEARSKVRWASWRLFEVRRLINLTREPFRYLPEPEQPANAPQTAVQPEATTTDAEELAPWVEPTPSEEALAPHIQEAIDLLPEIWGQAQEIIATWDGELIIVYLPHYPRIDPSHEMHGDNFYRHHVLAKIAEEELPLVDMVPIFVNHPDPMSLYPYGLFGHFSEAGYELVADEVLVFLER